MSETTCPVCTAMQPDGLLCHSCCERLERALGDVRWIVTELDTTLSRQGKIGTPGKGGLAREKNPIHLGALQAADTLGNVLTTWARDLMQGGFGPNHPTSVIGAAAVLLFHIDAIRRHPAVVELVDEITDAVEQARRAVDRPADKVYVGPCLMENPDEYGQLITCEEELYARVESTAVRCHVCATEHEIADRRSYLMKNAADLIVNVRQASQYIGWFGEIAVNQKTIGTWINRDQIPVYLGVGEGRRIRLGDLFALLTDKAEKKMRRVAA